MFVVCRVAYNQKRAEVSQSADSGKSRERVMEATRKPTNATYAMRTAAVPLHWPLRGAVSGPALWPIVVAWAIALLWASPLAACQQPQRGAVAKAQVAKAQVAKAQVAKAQDAGAEDAGAEDAGAEDAGAEDAGAEDAGAPDILEQAGPLREIAEPLKDLLEMQWQDGRLSLQMKSTYQEVSPIVDAIRRIVGWGGGSSSGGSNGFSFDISSEKINGYIRRSKQNDVDTCELLLNETVAPHRSLYLVIAEDQQLRITIQCRQSAWVLRWRQYPDGRIVVQELNGPDVFAGESSDFDSFCRRYRQYSADRLLPAFKDFGIGQVLTPYSPAIQQRVAELVSPWQADDLQQVRELTAGLQADRYEDRVAASRQLEQAWPGKEALLARLVHDDRFPPETRVRTRQLIRQKVDKDKLAELEFVDRLASRLDAAYLLELIQLQQDADLQQLLLERLRQTSPDLREAGIQDADVMSLVASQTLHAWASDQIETGRPVATVQPLGEQGHFQQVTDHVGQLVRLVRHDDGLRIDREHWKKPFGGREISELSAEVKALLEEHNLPKDWYNGGGSRYLEASARHPQVLFEKLQEQCGGPGNSRHYSSSRYTGQQTPNREFELARMSGELTFDREARNSPRRRTSGGNKNDSLDGKPFMLLLSEQDAPRRSLLVDESEPGQIRFMITGDDSNYILQLLLTPGQALLQDVRGSRVQTFQAATLRELQQQHPAYFRDTFFPLLRHLGVEVDAEIDAGREGQETTRLRRTDDRRAVAGR
jgi:hypothetical protein